VRVVRIGVLLLAVLAVAGCQFPVDYEGTDSGVFFPAFKASFQVQPTRREQGDKPPESGALFIDVDVSGGRGSDSQQISGSEFIGFNGTNFSGPTTVTGEWDLILGSVAARSGWELDKARIQGLLGLGLSHLDMEMSNSVSRESDTSTSLGPHFGARAEFDAAKWLSIYGQVAGMFGWGSGAMMNLSAFDVGVVGRPSNRMGIFAGYRFWGYREERSPSAIDLEMSGPVLGLQLDF
jgi:hypothetical protein